MSPFTTRKDNRHGAGRTALRRDGVLARPAFSRSAAVIPMLGLAMSLVAAFVIGRWENSVSNVAFAGAAKNQAIILQNGINEYLSRLTALKMLLESVSDDVTRREFEVFTGRLFEQHPGIFRVNWVPRVKRDDRAKFESAAVADGIAGYQFRSVIADGAVVPSPDSDEYFPVFYSTEPKTASIYGLNLVSDPARRAYIERARDNDAIATMPAHDQHVQAGNPNGVVVAVPVYGRGAARDTLADRRQNISGYITGVFELTRLLKAIIATSGPPSGINVDVYSAAGALIASPVHTVESTSAMGSLRAMLRHVFVAEPHWAGALRIGDATWQLRSTPAAGSWLAAPFDRAAMVFIAGILATAIAFAFVRFTSDHSRAVELARTDALTGLANRRAFFERLNFELAETGCDGGNSFAVLYFDLDHFKDVNDLLGHAAGDELLRQVADRLRHIVSPGDFAARLGGDEFAVIEHTGTRSGGALALRLNAALAEPYQIDGAAAHVTASIGVASMAPDQADADALMVQADLALYRAKEDGRNCCRQHSAELAAEVRERLAIADELRGAAARGELELHYQPQVALADGRILGLEALLRWHHPTRGMVSPALFVPIAERNGSILQIGEWAFDEACRQYRAWDDDGIAPQVLAVNFSAVQFKAAVDLESAIDASLKRWRIAADCMEVELAESVLMEVSKVRGGTFEKLRRAGLRIALDNFGTGSSSLSYLMTCPVNRLKIAQQMVRGVSCDPRSAAVVRAAIRLAGDLGIEFLAEGVETKEQIDFLAASGCAQAQGFYFSRPVDAVRAAALLRDGHIAPESVQQPPVATAA